MHFCCLDGRIRPALLQWMAFPAPPWAPGGWCCPGPDWIESVPVPGSSRCSRQSVIKSCLASPDSKTARVSSVFIGNRNYVTRTSKNITWKAKQRQKLIKIVHLDLSSALLVYLTAPGCLQSDGSHSILSTKHRITVFDITLQCPFQY